MNIEILNIESAAAASFAFWPIWQISSSNLFLFCVDLAKNLTHLRLYFKNYYSITLCKKFRVREDGVRKKFFYTYYFVYLLSIYFQIQTLFVTYLLSFLLLLCCATISSHKFSNGRKRSERFKVKAFSFTNFELMLEFESESRWLMKKLTWNIQWGRRCEQINVRDFWISTHHFLWMELDIICWS